jgi:release factor glutamine methyltransferase
MKLAIDPESPARPPVTRFHVSRPAARPVRLMRRLVFRIVFRLIVRPAIGRTDTTTMLGLVLTVPPSVFHPRFYLSTRALGNYLGRLNLRGEDVLEMGCGSGVLSLLAARRGAHVTSVDINPLAVECAARNATANGFAGAIRTLQSDLFGNLPAEQRFDLIFWNPPFFPGEAGDYAGRAWKAGKDHRVIAEFARTAAAHLAPNGNIICILSSDADIPAINGLFEDSGFTVFLRDSTRHLFETLYIFEYRTPM